MVCHFMNGYQSFSLNEKNLLNQKQYSLFIFTVFVFLFAHANLPFSR